MEKQSTKTLWEIIFKPYLLSLFIVINTLFFQKVYGQELDFTLTSYGPHNVFQGSDIYFGISATRTSSGTETENIFLKIDNLPPGASGSFPDIDKGGCCKDANENYFYYNLDFSASIIIKTTAATPIGSYQIKVTASSADHSVIRTVDYTIKVNPAPTVTAPLSFGPVTPIPMFSEWEQNMIKYGSKFCNEANIISYGAWDGSVQYYDGQRVYYQIADYLCDTSWYNCARYVEEAYRDGYVLGNNGSVPGYRIFSKGLYMDYMRTGDSISKKAAILLSQSGSYAGPWTLIAWMIDPALSRETAYNSTSFNYAEALGAGHNILQDSYIEVAIGHIDQWFFSKNAEYVRPFMFSLTAEALITYQAKTKDPRILPILQMAADSMWKNMWLAEAEAFKYTNIDHVTGGQEPASDLNLLIAPVYAWIYRQTGDPSYRDKADMIFAGGVKGAWLDQGKQFSQNYRWSFDYIKWRNGELKDCIAPFCPLNTAAKKESSTQINLTWDISLDNVNVEGYKIFRDEIEIGTSETNSFSDKTISPGNTYEYKVAAYDPSGNISDQCTTLSVKTDIVSATSSPNGEISMSIYPNPADNLAVINYSLTNNAKVILSVYDIYGHKILDLENGNVFKGDHEINLNVAQLQNGIYALHLLVNDEILITKVSVVK